MTMQSNEATGQPTTRSGRRELDSALKALHPATELPGYWETVATNTDSWGAIVSVSPFWKAAQESLPAWKKEYRRQSSSALYKDEKLPSFVGKSADRIREKTFLKVREAAENGGTIVDAVKKIFDSNASVPRLEDLVRVRIQCQLLDGVPFLVRKLFELAKSFDSEATLEAKGKLSGYFAQHITFKEPVHFRINGDASSYKVTCEIQVATSLGTMVWENSHVLYETSRMKHERPEEWQWDPKDSRFLARQLGHMIHLADGLFCLLRDSSTEKTNTP